MSAWEFVLTDQRSMTLSGTLSLNGSMVRVKGITRTQRTLPLASTTGYEFHGDGGVIGAVEVIGRGAV
jgi:hypothetical protein